jgi:hypothetical protein
LLFSAATPPARHQRRRLLRPTSTADRSSPRHIALCVRYAILAHVCVQLAIFQFFGAVSGGQVGVLPWAWSLITLDSSPCSLAACGWMSAPGTPNSHMLLENHPPS